jgi:perosamine synthetase
MSNIQAALGCAQMERIESLIRRKREIFCYYRDRLQDLRGVAMNPEPSNVVNGAWMPTIVFDESAGVTRGRLVAAFLADNIDARVFFYPLSGLSMFDAARGNQHAWGIPERAINLPSYHDMTSADQDRVIAVVRRLVKACDA